MKIFPEPKTTQNFELQFSYILLEENRHFQNNRCNSYIIIYYVL